MLIVTRPGADSLQVSQIALPAAETAPDDAVRPGTDRVKHAVALLAARRRQAANVFTAHLSMTAATSSIGTGQPNR